MRLVCIYEDLTIWVTDLFSVTVFWCESGAVGAEKAAVTARRNATEAGKPQQKRALPTSSAMELKLSTINRYSLAL